MCLQKLYKKSKRKLKHYERYHPCQRLRSRLLFIGTDFIGDDTVAMAMRDKIFAGHSLKKWLGL